MASKLNIFLKHTMRKFWLGLIITTAIGILFYTYLYYSEKGIFPSSDSNFNYLLAGIFTANSIGLSIFWLDKLLDKLLPWAKNLSGRLIIGIITDSLVAILLIYAMGRIFSMFLISSLFTSYYDTLLKLEILTVVGVVIHNVIYFALFSYNQYAVVQIRSVKSQRKQLKLQFEALKSQLSPHYLFNCLNTISSLIFKDVDLAEDFIRRLAQTYQYILANNQKQCVSLSEEIEFVKSYYYLLKVRFENNLKIEINLPPNVMDSQMPPLTLQMLVENAVKHNIITNEKPLSIYIHAIDNTDIKVTNTKTETPRNVSSFQVGLDNIQKRYKYFTDKKIKVDDSGKFTVQLPVIQPNIAKSA
ncbi:MAG: histidine kinase [Bacteroidota bacterium]